MTRSSRLHRVGRVAALERSQSTMDADTPPADPEPGSCTSSESPQSADTLEPFAIDLSDRTGALSESAIEWLASSFRRCASAARGAERHPADDVRVAIVDDDEMSSLHKQYKDDSSSTDVLTFDLRESQDEPLDVDLIICLDEANRQVSTRSHDTLHELLLYALHGLLHCLGYDDIDEMSSARMHAREDEILRQMRFGELFRSGGRARGDEA